MKIRSGFVSNSSSSSFILIFDKMPESVKDLIKMLDFRGASAKFTREEYAQRIFDELWGEKDFEKRKIIQKKIDEQLAKMKKSALEKFKQNTPDKVVRAVTYSDNDGHFDSILEHGGLFDNIEHIYINQH